MLYLYSFGLIDYGIVNIFVFGSHDICICISPHLASIVAVLASPLPAHMAFSHLTATRQLYVIQHIVD